MGISPAYTNIIAEETRDYQGKIWIINNDQVGFKAKIYLEGELSQYFHLATKELSIKEDDEYKIIEFTANLSQFDLPGTFNTNIVIEQVLENAGKEEITSKVILKHAITVEGSYPDKYIKTKLNFQDQGNQIKLISEVENFGKKDLGKVQTKFYVNDKKLDQHILDSETTSLNTKENKLLSADIDKEFFDIGEYEVAAVTRYDEQKVEISKKLIIGDPEAEVTYFDQYFIANKINSYSLDLLNKWNKPIENVYVDVEVKKDDLKVDQFRTRSVDLDALMSQRIEDYFDARNQNVGKYSFDFTVNFWNTYKMAQKRFQSELISQEKYQQLQQQPKSATNFTYNNSEVIVVESKSNPLLKFLGVLALINLFGLIYIVWRFKNRLQYEGGDNAF